MPPASGDELRHLSCKLVSPNIFAGRSASWIIDPTLISIVVSKLKPNSPTLFMLIDSDLIILAFGKSVSVSGTSLNSSRQIVSA